ncbi:MAG: helix-turn-helix transcriptional regulator [Candidatus Nitronauta litoralis]|uniref:Helix-turn-helix transcriptional regulator n=1 Tax=Candidatus Nitronauta litoralis TaxID=2705533 RepID=A0A7T0FYG4_9BACT|nr:MAG: helix-turn-helix transcriptional regulator [Candidatus Nitronauta litoralis]
MKTTIKAKNKRNKKVPVDDCSSSRHTGKKREKLTDSVILERAAEIFRAIGDTPRLRMLERLAHEECCVTELAQEFEEEISTISQRLRLLRRENLVKRRREGKHYFYSLADGHVFNLIQTVIEHANEDHR